MTPGVIVLLILTLLAGGVAAGLIDAELRLEERAAVGVVIGITATGLATFVLALATRLSLFTVLLTPVLLIVASVALGATPRLPDPRGTWGRSWHAALGSRRDLVVVALVAAGAALGFTVLFSHTLFERDGSIVAGYNTVWADWSLHATLASSFVHSANLPPRDPVFSGQTLLYPFLPDFHAATLQVAGAVVGASLAVPQVLLCTAITVLVVSLGRRLAGSVAVGVVAMGLCLVGGGLGFSGVVWDACRQGDGAGADCSVGNLVVDPGLAARTARSVPTVVNRMDQGRSYDNLENSPDQQLGNVQWYTPLLAWWLPQRTFVAGFAIGVCALLLFVVGMRAPPSTRSPFLAAGLLAGSLPFIHVHTLIALAVVGGLLALGRRRREWLWALGATALLAVPRLVQIAAGPHGAAAVCGGANADAGTHFPYLEPGWLWNQGRFVSEGGGCATTGRYGVDPLGVLRSLPRIVEVALTPRYWLFWVLNTGVVIVVCLVVALACGARRLPGPTALPVLGWLRSRAARVADAIPDDLRRFCLPFFALFVVANLVVVQEWDWDNTKLLAWWYLGAALMVAWWLCRLWRSGGLRALFASLVAVSLTLSAALSLTRVVQLEARDQGVPYTWAGADARSLAAAVEARTAPHAVVLTHGDPTDPLSTLAGRTAVLGYSGWVISYGTILGERPTDIATIYAGCAASSGCAVPGLLSRYGVDYVEVRSGGTQPDGAAGWFARTYHAIATSPTLGITVYDVRRS